MRYFLLMIAVVVGQSVLAADEVVITDLVVKKAVGVELEKPYGKFVPPMKLTEADLVKVTSLYFVNTKITDACLPDLAKLQQLT